MRENYIPLQHDKSEEEKKLGNHSTHTAIIFPLRLLTMLCLPELVKYKVCLQKKRKTLLSCCLS